MVNASLVYEILMYLNSFYFGMFATCEIGMGTLKFINLPSYTPEMLVFESFLILGLCALETFRIQLGRKGSLMDHSYHVWISVFLIIPVSLGIGYLLFYQHIALKLEYILAGIMMLLLQTELVFAILFLFSLCKPPTYE